MLKIKLAPDTDHCIETLARAEHRKLQNLLLESRKEHRTVEKKLELLSLFVETADFRRLRAESEKKMAEGKKVEFTIYMDKGSAACDMRLV